MIAGLIGGTVVGDPEAKVNNFAKIDEGRPGCISFLYDDKYEQYIYQTECNIVLVNQNFTPKQGMSPLAGMPRWELVRRYTAMPSSTMIVG